MVKRPEAGSLGQDILAALGARGTAAPGSWQTLVTEDLPGDYTCVFHPSMRASLDLRNRMTPLALDIALKRAYEPALATDGLRILVERLWPRGLTKERAAIDHWVKDLAPSPALRTWYGHRPERWAEFCSRYREELAGNPAALEDLKALASGRKVTFVFAAKDEARNSAVLLREVVLGPDG